MLSKYDEMLCHQTATTFDHVAETSENWRENIWCCAHDTSGQYFLSSHFGVSTNRNVMDASGLLMVDGKRQHNIRASREFRPVTDEVQVGPLSYKIIEGMKTVTWALEENEFGHSFEVEFEAAMPPQEEVPQYTRSRGRVIENMCRYAQTGRAKGWLKVDGKVHDIKPDTWLSHRDHSWGVRWQHNLYPDGAGFQPPEPLLGFLGDWHIFQFKDWAVCSSLREGHEGQVLDFTGSLVYGLDDDRPEIRLIGEEHDFRLIEGTRLLAGATITAICEDGRRRKIEIEPISMIYLQAAGYWPYKNFRLGKWMGKNWADGEILNTEDPSSMKDVSAAPTFVVKCRCGEEEGFGMIQFGIYGQHPKYAPKV